LIDANCGFRICASRRTPRATLMALLGGDRQASRNELKKLALYAHGQGEVTLEDVWRWSPTHPNSRSIRLSTVRLPEKPDVVETEFAKAVVAGTYPGMIISARSAMPLAAQTSLAVAEGRRCRPCSRADSAAAFFAKAECETALRISSTARLVGIIDLLATAALRMRKQAPLRR